MKSMMKETILLSSKETISSILLILRVRLERHAVNQNEQFGD